MRDATDITLLLDRTGSMACIREDTIGGYNTFVQDQRKVPGACVFTLIQFDSQDPHEVICSAVDIQQAPLLSMETYIPRADTPLLDAMGKTIVEVGERLKAMSEAERPNKVVFVVITDGHENASKEYKKAAIQDMIKRQQDVYKWEVVF